MNRRRRRAKDCVKHPPLAAALNGFYRAVRGWLGSKVTAGERADFTGLASVRSPSDCGDRSVRDLVTIISGRLNKTSQGAHALGAGSAR